MFNAFGFKYCLPTARLFASSTQSHFFIQLKSWWTEKKQLIKWIWNNWAVDDEMTNGKKRRIRKKGTMLLIRFYSHFHTSQQRGRERQITPQATKANKNARISVITVWYYGFKRRLKWANLISVCVFVVRSSSAYNIVSFFLTQFAFYGDFLETRIQNVNVSIFSQKHHCLALIQWDCTFVVSVCYSLLAI